MLVVSWAHRIATLLYGSFSLVGCAGFLVVGFGLFVVWAVLVAKAYKVRCSDFRSLALLRRAKDARRVGRRCDFKLRIASQDDF